MVWPLDVPLPPDAALARVRASINLPRKRALGIFKTQNEYVGVVAADAFEIWERRAHAVHAVGRVRGRRGGSRIEVEFHVNPRARILTVLFYVLYAAAVVQFLALRTSAPSGSLDAVVVAAGALAPAAIFAISAARQRANLLGFVSRLYAEGERSAQRRAPGIP